jgi:hypothetical protein
MDTFDINKALLKLKEREKELNCLYQVNEVLAKPVLSNEQLFRELVRIIPSGWQYQSVCEVRIVFEEIIIQSDDFRESEWRQTAEIVIDNNVLGEITVCYTQLIRLENNSQFLPEEQKLLNNIASRLGTCIFNRRLQKSLDLIGKTPLPLPEEQDEKETILSPESDEHWKWRLKMTEKIAAKVDAEKYGIKAFYIIGSTKNATAGPASDIDLLIHCKNELPNNKELLAWLEGWSLCLSEMNYEKTGYYVNDGLIDTHIITDEDILNKTSFSSMIGSAYNSARLLEFGKEK